MKSKAATVVMDVASEGVPSKRSWTRRWCHARRQGERDSGATNVAGRTDFHGFKAKKSERSLADTIV